MRWRSEKALKRQEVCLIGQAGRGSGKLTEIEPFQVNFRNTHSPRNIALHY